MTARPRIAVAPKGVRDWVRAAVEDGGGEVVEPGAAEALVWTATGLPSDVDHGPTDLALVLSMNPDIRWVQLPWAGVEPYAEAGVFDHDRVWTSGKGVYARPVAEHALGLAIAGLRDLKRFASARSWGEQSGISLVEGRVTIFGAGGVTRELVRLLAPFGCDVTVVRRDSQPLEGVARVVEFDRRYEALAGSDVIFLALALTPRTRGLIGAVELEVMEPHAWLVNVARGQHVVTDELVAALREGAIGGAALDVTDPEPLPEGHPLWALPNCLVTPHTANTEDMAVPLLSERITDNVCRFAAGQPLLGRVDPDLGY